VGHGPYCSRPRQREARDLRVDVSRGRRVRAPVLEPQARRCCGVLAFSDQAGVSSRARLAREGESRRRALAAMNRGTDKFRPRTTRSSLGKMIRQRSSSTIQAVGQAPCDPPATVIAWWSDRSPTPDPHSIASTAARRGLNVLRDHNNMPSPTLLFVLDDIAKSRNPQTGDSRVLLSFGPGLTMEAILVQWRRDSSA
jgi:Chalcone and stilbene synthases, C-terminal domain